MYPTGPRGRILNAWRQGELVIVLSRYILDETIRVLPKLARNPYSPSEMSSITESLTLTSEIVEPVVIQEAIRDKADLPVLGTLLAVRADYLITGDRDLLALAQRYPIVTPAAFWQRHGS